MKFTKMHGCGNDYIYVNCFEEKVENPSEVAIKVSDRRFGIGSDGLILIKPSEVADCFMDMYNMDGSRGKMCGNGIRCVGKYVYDNGIATKDVITVETLSGIKTLKVTAVNGRAELLRVDMGSPIFKPELVPVKLPGDIIIDRPVNTGFGEVRLTCVSMGNPHAVMFVEDAQNAPVHTLGRELEISEIFPEQANIEFCQVISDTEVRMRVWERGSGETWACGTGACATVVACVLNGRTKDEVTVHMNGGDVIIKYDRENDTVYMTGPATTVCTGDYPL
ncbi:MAG: diaminopimelate epimerase [Clostridiales bacterium]|nr:diaminopimelate epimerase [Clostridiales bacterium]